MRIRILSAGSAIALLLGPILAMGGAFSPSSLLMAASLVAMGAIGLFAAMSSMESQEKCPIEESSEKGE